MRINKHQLTKYLTIVLLNLALSGLAYGNLAPAKDPCLDLVFAVTGEGESGATHSPDLKKLDEVWFAEAKKDITSNWRVLSIAIGQNDPQIAFLKKLGFAFEKHHITIPSIEKIFSAVSREIDELIASGKLAPEGALYPARVFSKIIHETKVYLPVKFGESPPDGYRPDDFLSAADFAKFVRMGFYPIGEPQYGSGETMSSLIFHDLGHFGSMIEKPKFMVAIRKTYTEIERHPEYFYNHNFESRLIYVLENLVTIHEGYRPFILKIYEDLNLRLPDDIQARPTANDYFMILQTKNESEIALIKEKLISYKNIWVDNVGGLQRDITARIYARENNYVQHYYLGNNIRTLFEALEQNSFTGDELRHHTANLLVALDYGSRITPEDWLAAAAANGPFDKGTLLHDFVCQSGAINQNHIILFFCM